MKKIDIDDLIECGEGKQIEFKRKVSSPEKIVRTISAFANTSGGIILFGVDDDGSVCGVQNEKEETELINYAVNFLCEPQIEFSIDIIPYSSKKDVIVCSIDESKNKPHKISKEIQTEIGTKVFIRVEDETLEVSKEVVKIMESQRANKPIKILITEKGKLLFDYLEKNKKITLQEFCHVANIGKRRAIRTFVTLVRANILYIHTYEKENFYTLV